MAHKDEHEMKFETPHIIRRSFCPNGSLVKRNFLIWHYEHCDNKYWIGRVLPQSGRRDCHEGPEALRGNDMYEGYRWMPDQVGHGPFSRPTISFINYGRTISYGEDVFGFRYPFEFINIIQPVVTFTCTLYLISPFSIWT
jgi:hypothetical protein